MIVYIYGSESFKKDTHDLLEHSNIRFRLGDEGQVIDLNGIDELKNAIEDNPNNIYIIDDSKIIKENSLNKKIKFLQPKDGIEQEYLLDNGIGDISVDSMEELSNYIKNKLDSIAETIEHENIHDSIVEIVEGAYDDENTDYTLDDELSQLLTQRSDNKSESEDNSSETEVEQIDDISTLLDEEEKEALEIEISNKEENVSNHKDEDFFNGILDDDNKDKSDNAQKQESEDHFELELQQLLSGEGVDVMAVEQDELDEDVDQSFYEDLINSLSFEEDLGNIDDDNIDSNINENESLDALNNDISNEETVVNTVSSNQGEDMAEEFSEFDTLSEAELLEALNGTATESVSNQAVQNSISEVKSEDNSVSLGSSNSDDIAKLISQLLNNKTLEITIKVKD